MMIIMMTPILMTTTTMTAVVMMIGEEVAEEEEVEEDMGCEVMSSIGLMEEEEPGFQMNTHARDFASGIDYTLH